MISGCGVQNSIIAVEAVSRAARSWQSSLTVSAVKLDTLIRYDTPPCGTNFALLRWDSFLSLLNGAVDIAHSSQRPTDQRPLDCTLQVRCEPARRCEPCG